MIKGLYTAASGMISTMVQTDTMANNLSNVNTVGFKKNGVNFRSFPEMLIQRMDAQGAHEVGSVMSGSRVQSTAIDFTQGAIRQTGNTLDVAIQGQGFLVVEGAPGQTFYTRNGAFTLDESGTLVTTGGDRVMGVDDQPINFPPGRAGDIKIDAEGTISQAGNTVGQLKLVQIQNMDSLEKVSTHRLQRTETTIENSAGPGTSLNQGSLEMSNVNMVGELVNNITGLRLYEALQKNIQMQNQTLGKLVNEVGSYRG